MPKMRVWPYKCPRVAGELARGVIVGAWHESREIADKSEAAVQRVGDTSRILDARKDKWWADLRSEYDGLYRARTLNQEQKAKAGRLLEEGGRHRKAYPGWEEGSFDEHDDAVIVAEVLALGGKLFITSDTRLIDHALLNGWTERNRESHHPRDARSGLGGMCRQDRRPAGRVRDPRPRHLEVLVPYRRGHVRLDL